MKKSKAEIKAEEFARRFSKAFAEWDEQVALGEIEEPQPCKRTRK